MDPIVIVTAIQALVAVIKDMKANQTEPTPEYIEARNRLRELNMDMLELLKGE